MKRFEERKELIRKEVQDVRGLPWRPEGEDVAPPTTTGTGASEPATNGASGGTAIATDQANGNGAHNAEVEEEGVFL